ncbi:hypothetical protein ACFV1L_22140 [Kitasatospora sp. NPDC059646]|uniref:hypothetical protein n=1 Tax=Kitasatospora sp. NPDC059646 TaxID=3346893 RepID=UPI003681E66E
MTPHPAPDELGAELVALGLTRAAADGMLPDPSSTDVERLRRCAALVADWVKGPSAGDPGELREPLILVLDALARSAASYLMAAQGGDAEKARQWIDDQTVKARANAERVGHAHPAQPTALTLAWLYVEAQAHDAKPHTEEERERFDQDRAERHAAHCDRYVREDHLSHDAYTLVITAAELAASVLVHIAGQERAFVEEQLDNQAAELLADHDGEAPAWVPDDLATLS